MVEIRDARMSDLDALRDIFRRAALANDDEREVLLANPDALELGSGPVREGRTRVATAADGQVVGFATAVTRGEVVEIEDLFVDPDWMGQGVGRRLVREIVVDARRRRARRVEVIANTHALGFYRKVGFVVDREVSTRFRPARRMRLDVGDCG